VDIVSYRFAPALAVRLGAMSAFNLEILYEDNHLLAVNKPAGLPTMGVAPSVASVFSLAKQYIKRRYRKPGNVYLGIMSRLDASSSGVALLARTSKAAGRLTACFRDREVQKIYWALLSGLPEPIEGELVDWMVKDDVQQRMIVASAAASGAKEARLRYRQLRPLGRGAFIEVELLTGRKHQIRLQFASRGLPVWGETKYGRGWPFAKGIALHARRLVVPHPVRGELLELVAPVGQAWRAAGIRDE
jgi:23S rRNA pseudouridine1911/1915/1917 synthase